MTPNWLSKHLSADDVRAINEALRLAEKKTRGEIVPMIVRRSTAVAHVPVVLFLASLALCFVAKDVLLAATASPPLKMPLGPELYLLALVISAVIARALSPRPWVQRLLTAREDTRRQVHTRAEAEFYEAGLEKTTGATGILLFLSLAEHEVVVLADQGIAAKLPPEAWSEVVREITASAKSRNLARGFAAAISRCGDLLEKHFPIQAGDVNELKDELIVKD